MQYSSTPENFICKLKELMIKHNVDVIKPSNMDAKIDAKAEIFITNFTFEFDKNLK